MNRSSWCIVVAVAAILVAGCSKDDEVRPIDAADLGTDVVVGKVTRIVDDIASDGGVRMDLALDWGEVVVLNYSSWFTDPPPTEEHIALYKVILQVQIGDRVRAKGKRVNNGINLEDLTILN